VSRIAFAVLFLLPGCVQNLTGTPIVTQPSPATVTDDTGDTGAPPEAEDQDGAPDTSVPVDTGLPDSGVQQNGRDTAADTGVGA
jgi:hypothetical protein